MNITMEWKKIISFLLLMFLAWGIYLAISIYRYTFEVYLMEVDVAIVLGSAVWQDKPSPVFEQRIKHGITLYHQKKVQKLLFTGGMAKDGDILSEAEVARNYALSNGVQDEDIYFENISTITYENLVESQKILKTLNTQQVLIISDPLHMRRAMTMAQDLGINAYPSPTPTSLYTEWPSRLRFLLSETYLYMYYLLSRFFSYF